MAKSPVGLEPSSLGSNGSVLDSAGWEPTESEYSWDEGSSTADSPTTPSSRSRLGDGDRRGSSDSDYQADVLYGTVRRPPPLATAGRSASWTVRQISGLRHFGEYDTDTLTPRTRPKRHYRFWTIAVAVRRGGRAGHSAFLALMPRVYFTSDAVWETTAEGKKALKAGTLETVVETMAAEEATDPDFVRDVLMTYRYFTTGDELLKRLLERFSYRFEAPPATGYGAATIKPSNIPLRVVNALRRWLKEFFYDFLENPRLLDRVNSFIDSELATCKDESLVRWVEPLKKIIAEQTANRAQPSPLLPSTGPLAPGNGARRGSLSSDIYVRQATETAAAVNGHKRPERTFAELLKIQPLDLFRQLTLMELELFLQVTPADMYYKTTKEGAGRGGKRLMDLIDHFNKISFWVAKEVCAAPNLKHRIAVLKYFLHMATICLEQRNYNTCLEIVGGLNMTWVQRLKRMWKNLSSKYTSMWKELQKVMNPRQNYLAYREVLKTAPAPVFPYFGIFLSDLTMIHEKFPTFIGRGNLINFSKIRMISAVMLDMQRLQAAALYPIQENSLLRRFVLYDIDVVDDDSLYKLSKTAENTDEAGDGQSSISQRLGKTLKPVIFKEGRSSSLPDMYEDLVRSSSGNSTPP